MRALELQLWQDLQGTLLELPQAGAGGEARCLCEVFGMPFEGWLERQANRKAIFGGSSSFDTYQNEHCC